MQVQVEEHKHAMVQAINKLAELDNAKSMN